MVTCLLNRSQKLAFRRFFGKPDSRQREIRHFQHRHNQTQQGNQSGIATPERNDFSLQLSGVHLEDVECDHLSWRLRQPAVSG